MNNKYLPMNSSELGEELITACFMGDLNTVKYLLTSPELKEHADIHHTDKYGQNSLMWACTRSHIDIVKYLLTSSDLKEHSNINNKDKDGVNVLIIACRNGYLDIVKYLLTSSDLKEHVNIHHKDNNGWNALTISSVFHNLDTTKYLIIDMNMTINKDTINWLNGNNEQKIIYNDILKIIESRDLYNKLDNSLESDKIKDNKKIKI